MKIPATIATSATTTGQVIGSLRSATASTRLTTGCRNWMGAMRATPATPIAQYQQAYAATELNTARYSTASWLSVPAERSILRSICPGMNGTSTSAASPSPQAVADQVPEMIAGAGTVLSAAQAREAIENGAQFIVSPGLDESVVALAKENNVPIYPGTMTPSEVQRAFNLGLDTVKFFPASIAGGIPALKALASVFRSMKFMPTGGVSPGNLGDFLAVPAVLACGGSWLTPADAIKAGDYEKITALAAEAVGIARKARVTE